MSQVRAEILKVDFPDTAAARILINAPVSKVFNVIADPRNHQLVDGSGSIQRFISGPDRLFLGAKFGMAMKIRVPYRITNTVVAFEENKKIKWRHLMKWTWCYEFSDLGGDQTQVTESFDAHDIPNFSRRWLKVTGALKYNPTAMAKSLVKLKAICEG
jgi:uncharacterized protein YndB with AHSA1/START domain